MPAALSDVAVRTMHLVALDATNLLRRLDERHLEMVSGFSRLRDREALMTSLRCFGLTARFEDVAALPPKVQLAVTNFYELVDDLRWYFQFTVDMPGALAEKFTTHRLRLVDSHAALAKALEAAARAPRAKPPVVKRIASSRRK
jgi:hypothetical protein